MLILLSAVLAACGDVPVVDLQAPRDNTLRENMINANRHIAHSEETQIDSYIARRGLEMQRLAGGARVRMTATGNGSTIGYDDTVTLRYTVSAINDATLYKNVIETVIAGHLQPTRGLDASLGMMRVGSRALVILPSEQAYGVVGDGDRIGSRMILIFELEILKVKKKQ